MNAALARLIAGHIFLHGCMAGMRMTAPLLALREGYSAMAVGVLLALFAVVQIFLALPSGRYADRHGLKRPVGISVAVATTGAALAVLWPVFPVLCVSALMTGGATGSAVIALQRHVGRAAQTPTQLKQVFSWLGIGPAIANFFGPFSAGLLIDHAGFRTAFFFLACLPLVCWFWVRRTQELPPAEVPAGEARPRAWDLLEQASFRRVLAVNWLMSSCWDVHTFVVPVIGHEYGFSASAIGSILGAFAIAAAGVRVVLPLVASRIRERETLTVAMLAAGALLCVYPFLRTVWAMGACSVLLGFALGSVQPMVMSMLHQITPEHRQGEALGLRMMTINASSVLMPMLFGSAGALVGVSAVFWVVGTSVAAGARAAWGLKASGHKTHG